MTDIVETIEYRDHTIEIVYDYGPENPWKAWDCMIPIAWHNGGGMELEIDEDILNPLTFFTYGQTSRHWRRIAAILEWSENDLNHEIDCCRDGYVSITDCRNDIFEQTLSDMKPSGIGWGATQDYFEICVKLYELIKIPAYWSTVHGCSQGDAINVLAVVTPAFIKACGTSKSGNIESMRANIELLGDWAFGNVYGYSIPTIEDEPSCFGFYGDYYAYGDKTDPHIIQEAKSAIDWHIESQRKAKQTRLIEMIKNNVPFLSRPAILQGFTA